MRKARQAERDEGEEGCEAGHGAGSTVNSKEKSLPSCCAFTSASAAAPVPRRLTPVRARGECGRQRHAHGARVAAREAEREAHWRGLRRIEALERDRGLVEEREVHLVVEGDNELPGPRRGVRVIRGRGGRDRERPGGLGLCVLHGAVGDPLPDHVDASTAAGTGRRRASAHRRCRGRFRACARGSCYRGRRPSRAGCSGTRCSARRPGARSCAAHPAAVPEAPRDLRGTSCRWA